MPENTLKQLAYTSEAMIDTGAIVTPHFLERIQANNAIYEITGALTWRDKKFMQIIEGPSTSVNRLFATLLRDPRHTNIVLISERVVASREFPNWDMRAVSLADEDLTKHLPAARPNQRGSRILQAFRRGLW